MIHTSGRRSVPSARQAVLESQGLALAPAAVQRTFWRHYNHGRRRGHRAAVLVGQLAARCLERAAATSHEEEADRIAQAWMRVVPPALLDSTRFEAHERGRIRVTVDSAATRFVLSRQLYDTLLASLSAELPEFGLERIEFRVGAIGRSNGQARGRND